MGSSPAGSAKINIDRIKKNIIIDSNGCWIWQKFCSSSGYGQLTEKGKYWNTHVYVYTCENGPPQKGNLIRHSCHNRKCCNPNHLKEGTAKDNYTDSLEIHLKNQTSRRQSWNVNGIIYPTFRDALKHTGLSANSLNKYTINGLFNVEKYREGCFKARRNPKI